VPPGFRADVLISWGDTFLGDGETLEFGFNNDFLAYFPLRDCEEGILFVNHEYPDPFFQHGFKALDPLRAKSPAQVQIEQDAVGNSFLHVKRDDNGIWEVERGSRYNRRIYGDRPVFDFTGPRAGDTGTPNIGSTANGSVGNCSGGITPWGTALSCEENFDGYGRPTTIGNPSAYGWAQYGDSTNAPDAEYDFTAFAKYGWVCEHDPYAPDSRPRKHTALGRFRHENTAFRHVPGKPFVLYMGDDKANEGLYKFVSDRPFRPGRKAHNLRILESGTLYIARFDPEGRRQFANVGDVVPTNATSGTGTWVEVLDTELHDTATLLRARLGAEYDVHFAVNRPEDVEVAEDGTLYMAMTNNSSVKDSHGAVRRIREHRNDPTATSFAWEDFAAGGPPSGGGQGFSSPDNLTFDGDGNLWVVTDISSSRLNQANEYQYHGNNAMFMVPTSGRNAGVAYRFANMPVESEGTGPYFTPDFQTLFVCVQHPGEETGNRADSVFGDPSTYTSWWPAGNRTAVRHPATPRPSVVAVTRDGKH
jgi:secreted PhoX family phosphatase